MSFDSVKVEKLREFVSYLESDELPEVEGPVAGPDSYKRKLADRIKLQIKWLDDKILEEETTTG